MNTWRIQRIAFFTIIIDDMITYTQYWFQSIVPPILNLTLYFFIFGYTIGRHIPNIHGAPYIQFVVPGIIMILIVSYSYANAAYSLFRRRFDHSINDLLVAPVNYSTILLAYLTNALIKTFFLSLLIGIVLINLSNIHIHHWPTMVLIIFLTCTLFSLIGIITALICKDFQSLSILQIVLTPLIYLGGVFYSIQQLPLLMQKITLFNPLYYVINAFRYSLLGYAEIKISISLLALFLITAVLIVVVQLMFKEGIGLRT